MTGQRTYIIAGGGTGGHLYPALAAAEQLGRLVPRAKIVFACSSREIDRRILDPMPYGVVSQPVRPLPRGPRGWPAFLKAWVASSLQARQMVRDLRPAAVLGTGGFAAAPLVKAAASRGIATALLNPDAVPGKANLFLARRADVIFTQFPATLSAFPAGVRGKVRCVGCPVAERFLTATRALAVERFALRGDRATLLVLGGSLGAASINDVLAALAADMTALAEAWQVLHITGPTKDQSPVGAGKQRDSGGDGATGPHAVRLEYCHQMELAYAAADLVLCRAGAATVAELAATATPAVFLPYPYHKDQHQKLNAAPLAEAGAAVILQDRISAAANAEMLRRELIPLMQDSRRLAGMKRSARALCRPRAAADVAAWLAER